MYCRRRGDIGTETPVGMVPPKFSHDSLSSCPWLPPFSHLAQQQTIHLEGTPMFFVDNWYQVDIVGTISGSSLFTIKPDV